MGSVRDHITVCICTYKRPLLLAKLLTGLQNQTSEELFSYSVVVVDNDANETAKETVEQFRQTSPLPATGPSNAQRAISWHSSTMTNTRRRHGS
jgi:succinoglycan biosynthesis protein ExoM